MDVVSLYPSIPIERAIECVIEFMKKHQAEIPTYGIPIQTIKKMLRMVANNYYIHFDGKYYQQTKGVPMGAQYSPLVAIIYMNSVENNILEVLKTQYGVEPLYYGRYVDDTIIINNNTTLHPDIYLEVFNTACNPKDKNIKFTMEYYPNDWLPFLDISLKINQNEQIDYKWYQKIFHSGNVVHYESFVPDIVKNNFINNGLNNIKNKNNVKTNRIEDQRKFITQLLKNGYPINHIAKRIKLYNKKNKNDNQVQKITFNDKNKGKIFVKTNNYSNRSLKKLDKIAEKEGLPFIFITKKREPIFSLFGSNNIQKYIKCINPGKCNICSQGRKGLCMMNYIVYKLECLLCVDHEEYNGGTNRSTIPQNKRT